MSTLAYARLTQAREEASPGTSTSAQAPGVRTWIDALAALVPAEVLVAHATLIAAMTTTQKAMNGQSITVITEPTTLKYSFYALIVLAIVLYVGARGMAKKWDNLDFARMLIPGCAFVGWTMLQRTTAFDAAWPQVTSGARTAVALIGAIALGVLVSVLAYSADQKPQ